MEWIAGYSAVYWTCRESTWFYLERPPKSTPRSKPVSCPLTHPPTHPHVRAGPDEQSGGLFGLWGRHLYILGWFGIPL